MNRPLGITWLGRRDYDETSHMQEVLVERRRRGEIDDLLLLLEHPPTFTCGRRTAPGDLPQSRDFYRQRGFAVCDTPRGGQVTYHGPGQLVAYPIVDLRGLGEQPSGTGRIDVAGFVADLEAAMVEVTDHYLSDRPARNHLSGRDQPAANHLSGSEAPAGNHLSGSEKPVDGRKNRPGTVSAGVLEDQRFTGVWLGEAGHFDDSAAPPERVAAGIASGGLAKVGSLGLRISRGISSHGISLNVSCDLTPFGMITACGIEAARATSILQASGRDPAVREVGIGLADVLASRFRRKPVALEPESIGIAPVAAATA